MHAAAEDYSWFNNSQDIGSESRNEPILTTPLPIPTFEGMIPCGNIRLLQNDRDFYLERIFAEMSFTLKSAFNKLQLLSFRRIPPNFLILRTAASKLGIGIRIYAVFDRRRNSRPDVSFSKLFCPLMQPIITVRPPPYSVGVRLMKFYLYPSVSTSLFLTNFQFALNKHSFFNLLLYLVFPVS